MTDETIAAAPPMSPWTAADKTRLMVVGAAFGGMAFGLILMWAIGKMSEPLIDRMYRECLWEFSAYGQGAVNKCFAHSVTDYLTKRALEQRAERG